MIVSLIISAQSVPVPVRAAAILGQSHLPGILAIAMPSGPIGPAAISDGLSMFSLVRVMLAGWLIKFVGPLILSVMV